MNWEFDYNIINEINEEVEVSVIYNNLKILKFNSIEEEVDFFSMDMDDVESYLIENHGDFIELIINSI